MCWHFQGKERNMAICIKKKNITLKSVRWILQYKGFFYLGILCCWREKGLSTSLFNTVLFPSPSSPAASVLPLFPSLSPWSWSVFLRTSALQSSAFVVPGPQVASSERRRNRTGGLTGVASSKQPSAAGPAALDRADGRGGPPCCQTHKVHGGSGSQTLTHISWACPSDSLSQAYSSAKSTFVFMRTAECDSKLRAIPCEISSLTPIHGQLEIFTELLGHFFPPQYGQNKVYRQNNAIQIYSKK